MILSLWPPTVPQFSSRRQGKAYSSAYLRKLFCEYGCAVAEVSTVVSVNDLRWSTDC